MWGARCSPGRGDEPGAAHGRSGFGDHLGEYVAIDVDSGNWVVADREIAAASAHDVPWRRQRLDGAGRLPGAAQLRSGFHVENRVIQGMVNTALDAVVTPNPR